MFINVGYIDPSVMTYAIQAVAGVVIAVGAVVAVAWRRAKKKVVEKLGLEETTKKELEEEICIVEDEAEETAESEPAKEEATTAEE